MKTKKVNKLLNQEIELIHSILEKTNFNMDLFNLIDNILLQLIEKFPYTGINLHLINENDKLIIHDSLKNLYPDVDDTIKEYLKPLSETEIDYHNSNLWACIAIREDREFYEPDIIIEKMPPEVTKYFQIVRHRSLYLLPIKLGQEIYGILYLAHYEPIYLSEEEKIYIRRIGSFICKIIEKYRQNSGKIYNPEKIDLLCQKYQLTEREKEILLCVINGKKEIYISHSLFISPSTVRRHVFNIYQKMEVNNRMNLVKKILRE
ncbi:MAG: hypothetical protein CVU04_05790 [Bacteroidetes bacterium HGW-Bacteroidetes-20]|nr:MAG: hypothetical protein CVU04_05790 [Bacteroidetes bacterium HGW-Bacteroidetes-20]